MELIRPFLQRVMSENCKCYLKECKVTEIPPNVQSLLDKVAQNTSRTTTNPTCFQIFSPSTVSADSRDEFEYVQTYTEYLDFFVDLELLKKKSGIYKLPKGPLKWSTIVLLNPNSSDIPESVIKRFRSYFDFGESETYAFIKVLFWFLRKGVVDNILKQISVTSPNHVAMSVGSTKVTSDYDVTVYGSGTGLVATTFNKIVFDLFNRKSSIVFDCNIYGASFIELLPINKDLEPYYTISNCNQQTFWYMKESENPSEQHVWALFKLLGSIKETNIKISTPRNILSNNLLKSLSTLHKDLDALKTDYSQFIVYSKQNRLPQSTALDNLLNVISAINFKGEETYYTRGTFLDVVVNGQMCGGTESVSLSVDARLDSLVENLADHILHPHKPKYMDRIKKALENLGSLFDAVTLEDFVDKLDEGNLKECTDIVLSKLLSRIHSSSVKTFEVILDFMKAAPKRTRQLNRLRILKSTGLHPLLDEMGKSQYLDSTVSLGSNLDQLSSSPPDRDFRKLSSLNLLGGGKLCKDSFNNPSRWSYL